MSIKGMHESFVTFLILEKVSTEVLAVKNIITSDHNLNLTHNIR